MLAIQCSITLLDTPLLHFHHEYGLCLATERESLGSEVSTAIAFFIVGVRAVMIMWNKCLLLSNCLVFSSFGGRNQW